MKDSSVEHVGSNAAEVARVDLFGRRHHQAQADTPFVRCRGTIAGTAGTAVIVFVLAPNLNRSIPHAPRSGRRIEPVSLDRSGIACPLCVKSRHLNPRIAENRPDQTRHLDRPTATMSLGRLRIGR